MARFDVYQLRGSKTLVLDIQADLLSALDSRVIIPLVKADLVHREAMPRLKPTIAVVDANYRLVTTDVAAVPVTLLADWVANLEDQRGVIIDAMDFLLQGF